MRLIQCNGRGWEHGQTTFELKNHDVFMNGKRITHFFTEAQFLKWFKLVTADDYKYKANYKVDGTLTDEHLQIIANAASHCCSCHIGKRELD